MSFSIEILLGFSAVIAAITVPLIIYFLQKSKKRLAYEVVSNTQLVGVKTEVQNKIKIYYENKLVENVYLVSIRLINSGNQPISIDDFARPINIQLGSNTKILTCEVLEQNPKDLDVSILKMQNSFEIQPLLLNPNDSLTLSILLSDYREELEVSARVKGVRNIETYSEPQPLLNIILMLLMIPFILFSITSTFFYDIFKNYLGFKVSVILSTLFIFIIATLVVQMIKIWYEVIKASFMKNINNE